MLVVLESTSLFGEKINNWKFFYNCCLMFLPWACAIKPSLQLLIIMQCCKADVLATATHSNPRLIFVSKAGTCLLVTNTLAYSISYSSKKFYDTSPWFELLFVSK